MLSVRGTICNSFSHDIIFSFETKNNLYELELKHKKYVLGIAQRAGTQEEKVLSQKEKHMFYNWSICISLAGRPSWFRQLQKQCCYDGTWKKKAQFRTPCSTDGYNFLVLLGGKITMKDNKLLDVNKIFPFVLG